jgi:hypothetical protein
LPAVDYGSHITETRHIGEAQLRMDGRGMGSPVTGDSHATWGNSTNAGREVYKSLAEHDHSSGLRSAEPQGMKEPGANEAGRGPDEAVGRHQPQLGRSQSLNSQHVCRLFADRSGDSASSGANDAFVTLCFNFLVAKAVGRSLRRLAGGRSLYGAWPWGACRQLGTAVEGWQLYQQ